MDVPATRYARNGAVSIAYQAFGDGPGTLLCVNSWISQVEHLWTEPRIAYLWRRLADFTRVIVFDRRGSGLSDRLPPAPLEEQMDDVLAVLSAANADRVSILSETEGTALACLFAATHPDRVEALALWSPIPRIVAAADYPFAFDPAQREQWIEEVYWHWGEGVSAEPMTPSVGEDPAFRAWFAQLERLASGPGGVRPILRMIGETDVRAILPLIRVPTLVMRRHDNPNVDAQHAAYVCEHIPDARLVELPGRDQLVFLGDTEPVLAELETFLGAAPRTREPERVLATVLFTDIVGSTEQASRLGDRAWGQRLEAHRSLVRADLARHGGREVKTMGDGFLAVFDGPARAIRCALDIADGSRATGVEVRAGLHTGEVELDGDDVTGIAVHIAARVLAQARPGEVLVSRTVGDLVAGSGLAFTSRGAHELRGVPGSWELYAAA
jgi:class 3 adenylate cyclase